MYTEQIKVFYEDPDICDFPIIIGEEGYIGDKLFYKWPNNYEETIEKIKDRERRFYADKVAYIIKIKCNKEFSHNKYNKNIVAPSACENCGEEAKLHGHHEDYEHPLIVTWLCFPCHRKVHAGRTYQDFFPSIKFVRAGRPIYFGTKSFYPFNNLTRGMVRVDELVQGNGE